LQLLCVHVYPATSIQQIMCVCHYFIELGDHHGAPKSTFLQSEFYIKYGVLRTSKPNSKKIYVLCMCDVMDPRVPSWVVTTMTAKIGQ